MPKRSDHARPTEQPAESYLLKLLRSRQLCIAAAVALFLLALLAYAAPDFSRAVSVLIVEGGTALLWLISMVGLGAVLLIPFRLDEHSPIPSARRFTLLHLTTSAALGLGVMSLVLLGLGLAGWLNRAGAWALLVPGWIGSAMLIVRKADQAPEAGADRRMSPWSWLWLIVMPLLAIAVFCAMVPPGVLWTPLEPHGYDVVEYHLQVPREWYEAGRIIPLEHNVFSYFPFNVEMHYLLAMHLRGGPWAGMYAAQFMHLIFVALTVLAVYGFASRWAPARSTAIFAALVAVATPWLALLAPIAYNEGGLLLFGTLAIGWALDATMRPSRRPARFPLAGLMAGFACGSKLTAVPLVLLATAAVCIAGIFLTQRRSGPEVAAEPVPLNLRPGGVGLFLICGLLSFSPWLVRNFMWTRNPLFPEAASVFGSGHFTPVQVERWHLAHRPPPAQQSPTARIKAGGQQILGLPQRNKDGSTQPGDFGFGYVFVPLVLIGAVVARARREVWVLALLLLVHAIFWLAFTHLQGRFFVLAIPIGALLLAHVHWQRLQVIPLVAVVFLVAISWVNIHKRLGALTGVSGIIGTNQLDLLTRELTKSIPPDANVKLIGDARAFNYKIPMSQLHYRTVFDVVTTDDQNLIDAWAGGKVNMNDPGLLINPPELVRLQKTYYGLPPVPDWILRAGSEPFVPAARARPRP